MKVFRIYYITIIIINILCFAGISEAGIIDYEVAILNTDGAADDCFGNIQVGMVDLRAAIWSGTEDSWINVNPEGFTYSRIWATSGNNHVGYASTNWSYTDSDHAILWTGCTGDFVDLHPDGYRSSVACGVYDNQQVGFTYGPRYAILWSGSAEDYTILHPDGYLASHALDIFENQQVGNGIVKEFWHALLWSGTSDSAIDLHPDGYEFSVAYATNGVQQAGYGQEDNSWYLYYAHALVWSGSKESVIDVHPSWLDYSAIYDMANSSKVGLGGWGLFSFESSNCHALLWEGEYNFVIDLHYFLPDDYVSSHAFGIDIFGNIVGCAVNDSGDYHAVLWQKVPEPATIMLLGIGAIIILRKK